MSGMTAPAPATPEEAQGLVYMLAWPDGTRYIGSKQKGRVEDGVVLCFSRSAQGTPYWSSSKRVKAKIAQDGKPQAIALARCESLAATRTERAWMRFYGAVQDPRFLNRILPPTTRPAYRHSDETLETMSCAARRRWAEKGPMPAETREKIREAHIAARRRQPEKAAMAAARETSRRMSERAREWWAQAKARGHTGRKRKGVLVLHRAA